MLENSYCGLIDQIQRILAGESNIEKNDKDVSMYFKLSTFMLSVCRYRAYDDHKTKRNEAMVGIRKAHAEEERNRVLGLSKSKSKMLPVPKVPFNIDISTIGASL
jgi:hypothetical protein